MININKCLTLSIDLGKRQSVLCGLYFKGLPPLFEKVKIMRFLSDFHIE